MSNGSPTAYLLWAILSCFFMVFLLLHLWAYDRFACLKWSSGRQPGAFKRVMTYTYITTVPLLVLFGVAMTVMKFREGYIVLAGEIIPRPYELWDSKNLRWVLPLYFVLSIAWSFELVTHLEELAFWLFLLHQGPGKREWFQSWEFRAWYLASMVAVLGMPLTTLITRRQLELCQAWIFLIGSAAGTSTTLCFLYVLAKFPAFIRHVKAEGADPDVVVRLATFYQLNRIRVLFRFVYTPPLLLLAVDGITAPYPIVKNPFAFDFLLMMGSMGSFFSSAITLHVFFPRSIANEMGYTARVLSQNSTKDAGIPLPDYEHHYENSAPPKFSDNYPTTSARTPGGSFQSIQENQPQYHDVERSPRPISYRRNSTESETSPEPETDAESNVTESNQNLPQIATLAPEPLGPLPDDTASTHLETFVLSTSAEHPIHPGVNYRGSVTPTPGRVHGQTVSRGVQLRQRVPSSHLHPYVVTFTSPIDLLDLPNEN